MAKLNSLTTGPIGDAPEHLRTEGASGATSADAEVIEVTAIDLGPPLAPEDAAPSGHENMPGRERLKSGAGRAPIVVSREDRLRKRVPGGASPQPEADPVRSGAPPAAVASAPASEPTPAPEAAPEPVDPEVLALLGDGGRSVSQASLREAQAIRPVSVAPPDIPWFEHRAAVDPVIEVAPSVTLLNAYADALGDGSASRVWVGGYGTRLESFVHGLISAGSRRKCTRVHRLTTYERGEARMYVWTGWGILYRGRWRLVVWEVVEDADGVRPVTALLCDPKGVF